TLAVLAALQMDWQPCPCGSAVARSETGHNSENRRRSSCQRWQSWQPCKWIGSLARAAARWHGRRPATTVKTVADRVANVGSLGSLANGLAALPVRQRGGTVG